MNAILALAAILAPALTVVGTCFCLLAVVGMLRFPDVYTRLHAGTKCLAAGALLIFIGVAILEGSWPTSGKVLLIAMVLMATNPIAAHAVARASYRQSDAHPTILVDELQTNRRRTFDDPWDEEG